jgi:hypothetical protein
VCSLVISLLSLHDGIVMKNVVDDTSMFTYDLYLNRAVFKLELSARILVCGRCSIQMERKTRVLIFSEGSYSRQRLYPAVLYGRVLDLTDIVVDER